MYSGRSAARLVRPASGGEVTGSRENRKICSYYKYVVFNFGA